MKFEPMDCWEADADSCSTASSKHASQSEDEFVEKLLTMIRDLDTINEECEAAKGMAVNPMAILNTNEANKAWADYYATNFADFATYVSSVP